MPRKDGGATARDRYHSPRQHISRRDSEQALTVATDLIRLGCPVGVARPAITRSTGEWATTGGHGGSGFWFSDDWENTPADLRTLDRWRYGDALFMVTGHTLDVIDIDPRNGGDDAYAELARLGIIPEVYARAATPSGGQHLFIAGTGARKTKRDGIDLQAGDADGNGRGFVFIAPTVRRSKADGVIRPYVWGQA